MRTNLHKTWCLCNIIFVILTCFHLTYYFDEEKFSALPSKDKAAICIFSSPKKFVKCKQVKTTIWYDKDFRSFAALNETHLHLLYQSVRLLFCESLKVSFFQKILGPGLCDQFCQIAFFEVRIFWEGYWVALNFEWKIFSNFLPFSEYPNFKCKFYHSKIEK